MTSSNPLVERLISKDPMIALQACYEAADEIKRLERELAHTRKLLDAIRPAAETKPAMCFMDGCTRPVEKLKMCRQHLDVAIRRGEVKTGAAKE